MRKFNWVCKFKGNHQILAIVVVCWIPVVSHHFLGFVQDFVVFLENHIEFGLMACIEIIVLSSELSWVGEKFVRIVEHHFI